jgi:hypothetical protein
MDNSVYSTRDSAMKDIVFIILATLLIGVLVGWFKGFWAGIGAFFYTENVALLVLILRWAFDFSLVEWIFKTKKY